MKVTNTEKTKLGIFVILIGAILIIALYFIGKKQNLFGNTFKITAVFSNVNGLKLGNNVRFSGINVGTVKNIMMVDDSTICVDMVIDEEIRRHMKQSAVAVVGSDGLVGSMVVNIFPGGSRGNMLQEGDTIQSLKRKSSADMMSTLSVTNDNAAELSKELLKITKSINEGDGTLSLLLNDKEMGDDLKQTFQNLNQASVEASKAINEVKDFVNVVNNEDNLINVLVRDSVSARQFRNIISNLEKSSEDIDLVIRNLNDFIVEIKDSQGTLNYIVSDTVLVQDIGETVKNIKKGSEMLNENLEALRHNTFFKGYFRKQEKERLKEEKRQNKLKE